jgi:hypothetical protein
VLAQIAELKHRLVDQAGFLLLGIAIYVVIGQAADLLPLSAQVVVLALAYVPLGFLVYRLSRAPDDTLAPLRRHGLAAPFCFVTGLWLAAVGWCAGLGLILDERGVVDFHTPDGGAISGSGQIADLLVWHSFDQIPALAVNDTLQWDVPLEYASGAGFLVLAFKLLILLPLVPVFAAAVRHRPPVRKAAPTPGACRSGGGGERSARANDRQ